jgi:hypothetical protein
MKNFVDAFDNLLTREQIKSLVYKLENDKLLVKSGGGRSIKYELFDGVDTEKSIIEQFMSKLPD